MKSERLRDAKRERGDGKRPVASQVSGVGAASASQLDPSQDTEASRRSGRVVRRREAPEPRGRRGRVDEEEQEEGADDDVAEPENREEGGNGNRVEQDGGGRGAGLAGLGNSHASGPRVAKRERGEDAGRRAGAQAKKEAKKERIGSRRGWAEVDEEDEEGAGGEERAEGRRPRLPNAEPRGEADGDNAGHPDAADAQDAGAGEDEELALFRGPARGEDDFCKGNILSIKVKNFMTFGSITLKPSPRLNLIVGPNGTGKSSIVCAIGIALAGEPRMLGRAADVRDFVQRGKEKGMVQIELRGACVGESITVERRIDVQNRSEWFLNGMPAKREDVRRVMKDLNIQVENLTQFLPQDRVCEFAGLSRERLLEETLKAVGDPQLSDEHKYLCEARGKIKQQEDACRASTETLGRLRKENEEIERDVQRLQQRQKLLDEAELMKKKGPWITCSELERSCEELQESVARLTEGRDQLHAREIRAREPPGACRRVKEAAEGQLSELTQRKRKLVARRERAEQEAEELGEKVRKLQSRANAARASERRREQKLQQSREEAERLEKEVQELPDLVHPSEKLEPLGAQGRAIRQQLSEKEMGIRDLERQLGANHEALHQKNGRLRFVQNARNRRIRRANDDRLEEACRFLDASRASLKAPVYGPLLAEVTVTDPSHSSCLEQHVPQWAWKCFVTTNKEDRDYLVPRLRQYNVSVVNEEGNEEHFRAVDGLHVSEKLRSLGVTHRMDEVFSAPPVVRHTLIKQGNLNHAFIGNEAAEQNVDAIHREGVMDLSTPQSVYFYRRSKYHAGVSMSLNPIRPSRLFGREEGGLKEEEQLQRDIEELSQERERLGGLLAGAKGELAALERQSAEVERQREEITGAYNREKRGRDDLQRKLAFRKNEVASLEAQGSQETEAERLLAQVPQVQEQQFAAAQRIHKALLGECRASLEMADLALALREVQALMGERAGRHRALREELISVQQQLQQQEARLERAQAQAQAARQEAMEVINPDEDDAVRELFDELPDNLEELEEAVREKKREADRLLCNNPHLAEQYERRKAEIERKSEALEEQSAELARLQAQLDAVQARWLPKLRALVGRINTTFAHNFREMAVAGEVVLDEHGDDFKAYGIRIRVQFRDTAEMQDLSAHHQSGGERSVSTILYLVALQELTYCPFRVVDEINQGMDATNERKMFQQLVRATCKDNTPQCFLVTPKLLPDLDYGDRCTIHTVMNGPHNRPITSQVPGFRGGEALSQSVLSLSQSVGA